MCSKEGVRILVLILNHNYYDIVFNEKFNTDF